MSGRPLFLVAALALLLTGCSDPPPPTEAFTVRGVYLGVLYDSAAATVDHEAIPGFMEAMQMPFRVADPALLRGLETGDPIRFRLADTGDGYAIQSVEPLPPGTRLVLAGDTAASSERTVPEPDSVGAP